MDRDVEDRVVAMDAVVASSKEGGVQGRRSGRPVGRRQWVPVGARLPGPAAGTRLYCSSHWSLPLFPQHKEFQYLPAALKLKSKLPPCSPALPALITSRLLLTLLQPHRPPYCSSNTLGTVLPQDLCACSFSLDDTPQPLPDWNL